MIIIRELSYLLEFLKSEHKSFEDLSNIRSLLHGDNSQLILFIDPGEESLIIVVEDTSVIRPVSVYTACLEESVSFFEQKVICDQLILVFLTHCT
jgi:hypothetical protein